jgi:hypothetical protein
VAHDHVGGPLLVLVAAPISREPAETPLSVSGTSEPDAPPVVVIPRTPDCAAPCNVTAARLPPLIPAVRETTISAVPTVGAIRYHI